MRFTVRHLTRYEYSAPIRLGPHVLRLTPRGGSASGGGRVIAHHLRVLPEPVARREALTPEGNPVTHIDFAGETQLLEVESRFTLDTQAPGPLPQPLPALPWPAEVARGAGPAGPEPDASGQIAPALIAPALIAPEVARYSDQLRARAGGQVAGFLALLTADLHSRTDRHIRPSGYAQSAAETLITARGACRDIAVLFIAAVQAQGMQARFVSGYQAQAESVDGQRHLHAWPEVWIPGAGWRGFDPTHGLPVGDGHVALCAAADQRATMPVEGGFWGGTVLSRLSYTVEISTEA